jgi:hypothetical protein
MNHGLCTTKGWKETTMEHLMFADAQDDDNDYSESGYVAVVKDSRAAIAAYGHNSCFGTWTAIYDPTFDGNMEARWEWEGTIDELVAMAKRGADPAMPERAAQPDDYDYEHLVKMYSQVVAWDKAGRPRERLKAKP